MEDDNGKIEYAYYRGYDSDTVARLTLSPIDGNKEKCEKDKNGKSKGTYRKSVAGLGKKFQKCAVDILGKNITKIEQEERQGFDELFKNDDE